MKVTGVSYSSDKKLSRCEKQYSYRYDQKLKRKVKKIGLFRGDWMHQLIEVYRRKQDWKARFKKLKKEQWDILFDEEKENYGLDFPKEVYGLMAHYVATYRDHDTRWKIVEIEKSHELMTKFGWPVRWKSDYVVREGGINILVENKNKKEIPKSEERILAPQVHGYCYLLSKIGIRIDKIIWDYVRTEPVPRPKILKDGSLSKRKINTDQRSYRKSLKEAEIDPSDYDGMEEHIDSLPETLSLLRIANSPNLAVGRLFVASWITRAKRAESIKDPLRTWVSSCKWDCDYYALCQIDMLGKDRTMEISKNFVQETPTPEEELHIKEV